MARLVCPTCKTVHQVSVLQKSYRELPCKRCGDPIPLGTPPHAPAGATALHRPLAIVPMLPLAAESSGSPSDEAALAYSTQSFRLHPEMRHTPEPRPRAIPVTTECGACGALHDRTLDSCPMCGFGGRAPARELRLAPLPPETSGEPPAPDPGTPAARSIPCPSCQERIHPDALKCRHCKQFVIGPAPMAAPARRTALGRVATVVGAALLLVALVVAVRYIRSDHAAKAAPDPPPMGKHP